MLLALLSLVLVPVVSSSRGLPGLLFQGGSLLRSQHDTSPWPPQLAVGGPAAWRLALSRRPLAPAVFPALQLALIVYGFHPIQRWRYRHIPGAGPTN